MYIYISQKDSLPKELTESKYLIEDITNKLEIDTSNGAFFLKVEQINFFVGSNNSGKSRFLRGLLKIDKNINNFQISEQKVEIQSVLDEISSSNWYQLFRTSKRSFIYSIPDEYIQEFDRFYNRISNKEFTVFNLVKNKETFENIFKAFTFLYDILINPKNIIREDLYNLSIIIEKILLINEIINFLITNNNSDNLYIPTLRNSIKSDNYDNTVFEKTIKKIYQFDKEKIYTGQNLYEEVLKVRNSIKEKRKGFEKFENFLSVNFFNKLPVEIIADLQEKQLIFFVNGDERKIQDIGDGIQQIILLLFPIYTSIDNSWFFIEEPETHLHPGLQRLFIETLLNDKYLQSKNLRYFFTTHSNHFLDLSIDFNQISILQFEKINQESFLIKNVVQTKETLDLLGVNNSSVFLCNSSIWVEGPTDRKYISKFLKLYCEYKKKQHLKENIDFAFFEYGGNLIAHYLFEEEFDTNSIEIVKDKIYTFALSNKIYLLADDDNADYRKAKGKRRKKLEELSNNKNFKYQNTIHKEIENLLPVIIIKDFIKTLVDESEIHKIELLNFNMKDYKSEGLGKFISELFKKNNITKVKKFESSTGTTLSTTYKLSLCDLVINGNYDFENLIVDNIILENIITELYDFIKPK